MYGFYFLVEVMSSMLNIGLGVGFLPGMFYDRFGPQWTSLVGLVVSVGAYMLLWSTTRSNLVAFYSKNSWLMAIYFFVAGKLVRTVISETVKKVLVGNALEKVQSERNSHSKNRGGKN